MYKVIRYNFFIILYKMNHNINNGRVNIDGPKTSDLFNMYDKIPVNQCVTFRNPTEGLWDNTLLSQVFFSNANITILQNGIRAGVYKKSNNQYIIGKQDIEALKIIMRTVFLQHATNLPNNIKNQIENLNKMVIDYSVNQIYSEAIGYQKYLSDASSMYTPIAPPILSKNNDKQLELKPWF
jgi:hypothetical protein